MDEQDFNTNTADIATWTGRGQVPPITPFMYRVAANPSDPWLLTFAPTNVVLFSKHFVGLSIAEPEAKSPKKRKSSKKIVAVKEDSLTAGDLLDNTEKPKKSRAKKPKLTLVK